METEKTWGPAQQAAANETAQKYAGTPHYQNLDVPGTGVDCIHFVMAVLRGAEILPAITLPYYDSRIGRMRDRNIMEDIFLEYLHAERAVAPYQFGDIVICKVGQQTNHVGIVMGNEMLWHVPARGAVGPEAVANWTERIQCALRITRPGLSKPVTITAQEVLDRV